MAGMSAAPAGRTAYLAGIGGTVRAARPCGRHGDRVRAAELPAEIRDADNDPGQVLLGVNIEPNLTYAGSLATLLWRRIMHQHGPGPSLRKFTKLGLLTVPAGLVLAVLALWGALHVIGG